MPTVTDRQRQPRQRPQFYIEHEGIRGGPFAVLLDSGRILDDPNEPGDPGDPGDPRRGRLTLRRGTIQDPFLRRWILSPLPAKGEYLELSAETDDGQVLARWNLRELRILEIADRRRRQPSDVSFDYILLECTAQSYDPDDHPLRIQPVLDN